MSDQPRQTPILDLLRGVPADAHMVYEVNPTHHQSIPVGGLAKDAADEIERLTNALWKEAVALEEPQRPHSYSRRFAARICAAIASRRSGSRRSR